jgi:putative glutamine amidotransferase
VPARYGKTSDSSRCECNPKRDTLEFALIQKASDLKMPILGVCRGLQILNVALGGTLIVDIPADHPGNVIHRCEDYKNCAHKVQVTSNSFFSKIVQTTEGDVLTNHHQAIEKPAPALQIVAWSADSIPEAIEWKEPAGKPFLLAVQWHPERMDTTSRLSMPIVEAFVNAVKNEVDTPEKP